jgi:hypothetical protein
MTLDLDGISVRGPAITPGFLRDGLTAALIRAGGLPFVADAAAFAATRPRAIADALGYRGVRRMEPVRTYEGPEDAGWLMHAGAATSLRLWMLPRGTDPETGARGSALRTAQRVLAAAKEAIGLIANGESVRLLLCEPSRTGSVVSFAVGAWREETLAPDASRILLALAGADRLAALPEVLRAAALHQVRITAALRRQARDAILGFINALPTRDGLDPAVLWREALLLVYRLLFVLKLESASGESASSESAFGGCSFAATLLWRNALSPSQALGMLVRRHLDHGAETGRMLQDGLRMVFAVCRDGLLCNELAIAPLGGGLFAAGTTPLLDSLDWGERAVALLLDRLIWITDASGQRARVHYASLDVEELGSIYEALLEQEPGLATAPMWRRRHGRVETAVAADAVAPDGVRGGAPDIMPGTFFLRAGAGRKSSGAYYTPHDFVHFLVKQALAPLIAERSPPGDPRPAALLGIRVVDPAMGSGHFLVEACRQLADALLAACLACDALGRRDRIAALPDRDGRLAAYLPSRGFSEATARALCRRLVAVHCLYGCDRNGLAVELAKLSLWLESHAEGLPLTFLDHRLVSGDALTGPFLADMATLPVTGGPLDPLLAHRVADRLAAARDEARALVAAMGASLGRDLEDLDAKQALKRRLDSVLDPLRRLAGAWTGAAMLRTREADDEWLSLARQVAETGTWPGRPSPMQARLAEAGREAVPWDLAFPEVFPGGFSVVLGNPPWDVLLPNTRDFLAAHDLAMPEAHACPARGAVERQLLRQPAIAAAFARYRAGIEQTRHVVRRLYRHQHVKRAGGSLDLYRLFAERGLHLVAETGTLAWVMPSSFHAAEGSIGVRSAYLADTSLDWLLSFENRRRVFDIDSRYKFDLIVARRPGPTDAFRCGFYLDRIADADDAARIMTYDRAFLALAGGTRLTPPELRGAADLRVAERLFAAPHRFGDWCAARHIRFGCDLHMTHDAGCFLPAGRGDLVLHEGKTFHQYTDHWDTPPRHGVASAALPPALARAAVRSRLAFRDIARSNDERTMIALLAPPGSVFGHTATVEKTPWARSEDDALLLCALLNSFCFDWLVRQKAATHLSLYLLHGLPVPDFLPWQGRILRDAARALSAARGKREDLRATVDAVVARAYRLDRAMFVRILAGFSHRSRPDAAARCVAAFDALAARAVAAVA